MTIFNSRLSALKEPEDIIIISEGATKRLKEITTAVDAGEDEGAALRFWVEGGGCSGLQTRFKLDKEIKDDDYVFENDGMRVLVDETSFGFLAGATVEFTSNLMGSWFHLSIPKAENSCSCGSSFSVSM